VADQVSGNTCFSTGCWSIGLGKNIKEFKLSLPISDLPCFAIQVCEVQGVDEVELYLRTRKRQAVKWRRIFPQIAVQEVGYSGADVARFLGINTFAVNGLAVSEGR
jgi:hypothetical protein